MEYEKDYSLLRPFDLEAAKRGEAVLQQGGDAYEVRWVARSGNGKSNIVEGPGLHAGPLHRIDYAPDEYLRMAPLAWVEGKPVYKGDVLYGTKECSKYRYDVIGVAGDGIIQSAANETGACYEETCYLTWTPPKVKREGFVCIVKTGKIAIKGECADVIVRNCSIFPTHEAAQAWADQCGDVIAIAHIVWEEPAP